MERLTDQELDNMMKRSITTLKYDHQSSVAYSNLVIAELLNRLLEECAEK